MDKAFCVLCYAAVPSSRGAPGRHLGQLKWQGGRGHNHPFLWRSEQLCHAWDPGLRDSHQVPGFRPLQSQAPETATWSHHPGPQTCWGLSFFSPFFLLFLALSSWNPAVHPILGEMVAYATVSLNLYILSRIRALVLPATRAAALWCRGYQWWSLRSS